MLWILLMFAGMGLFMLGIVFGEWIDLWYCRTKYDRDDSYKVIEERENTARKLNREKQKLEKEVHSLHRQIEGMAKDWGFQKSGLDELVAKYKSISASWYDEYKKKDGQIQQVLDILVPNYKELSEKEFFGKWGPNLSQEAKPINAGDCVEIHKDQIVGIPAVGEFVTIKDYPKVPKPVIKEEWFDLSKKRPEEGQKIYLNNKYTVLQDLGEYVDRSASGVAFIKRNGQNHTSSLIESEWEWRPL